MGEIMIQIMNFLHEDFISLVCYRSFEMYVDKMISRK